MWAHDDVDADYANCEHCTRDCVRRVERFKKRRRYGTNADTPATGGISSVTITIANSTVSPKNVNVTRGNRVTFTNNDTQGHNMHSDPHPFHTDCPEIDQVGFVAPGQSQQTGRTFMTARTCGYYDHDRDTVEGLKGTITVQ